MKMVDIIIRQWVFSCLPEKCYPLLLKSWYKRRMGKQLNLKNPKTYNEKIQWLKLYDNTPVKSKLADKYEVRNWVKEKIGEEYLIPLLGVWDKFDDIDFDKLPDKFVLKTNHGSGMNIIVQDKSKLDKVVAEKKFNRWLKINYTVKHGFELWYKDIKPKIIAEEYIKDNDDGSLKDYKFMCFDGEPKFVWVDSDRYEKHHRNIFDLEWNELKVNINPYPKKENLTKPKNLSKMIELARILSKGFIHVRVDFYEADDSVYFGEITFASGSGIEKITPESFELKLSELIKIPVK